MVLNYRLRCLEYTSTNCHSLHQAKWAKSIWRYLVCKHLSDSNFFLFVLKFNYGCIWIEINGDNFSPTDGGLFECALMITCKPLWGEGEPPEIPGSFSRRAEALLFMSPFVITSEKTSRELTTLWEQEGDTVQANFIPTFCDSRQLPVCGVKVV